MTAVPYAKMLKIVQRMHQLFRGASNIVQHRRELAAFFRFCHRTQPGFEGSVQPDELAYLQELVVRSNLFEGPVVEVGTLFGFTTQSIAMWKKAEKELITIDDYSWNPLGLPPQAHREFTRRCLAYVCSQCRTTLFEGTSSDFHKAYSGPPPAMIFIDASHEYPQVLAEITWARQAGVPIIAGHDYSRFWPGVRQAVEESFGTDFNVSGTLWAHVSSAAT